MQTWAVLGAIAFSSLLSINAAHAAYEELQNFAAECDVKVGREWDVKTNKVRYRHEVEVSIFAPAHISFVFDGIKKQANIASISTIKKGEVLTITGVTSATENGQSYYVHTENPSQSWIITKEGTQFILNYSPATTSDSVNIFGYICKVYE